MNCPSCQTVQLTMSERSGIEIDYCPQCRGVWLDRGELDKIIERSTTTSSAPPPARERDYQPRPDDRYREQQHSGDYYKHKKKKGFLGELFDFD